MQRALPHAIPVADSGVAGLIRAHDWVPTALGPTEGWPQPLSCAVKLMLDSPEPMYLAWGADLIVLFNDAMLPVLNDRAPHALGSRLAELWDDDWPQIRPAAEQALAGQPARGEDLSVTLRRHGREEETSWSCSYRPLADDEGGVAGMLCIATETTQHRQSAAALSACQARHRQILDSALDYAIIAIDLAGRVTSWNEGAAHILGWTEAEMVGELVHRFFTPEDVESGEVRRAMQAAVDRGRGVNERWHVRRSGERFWASCDTAAMRAAEGHVTGFVKVLRDRTERRAMEAAAGRDRARLAAAIEVARLGTFECDLATGLLELSPRSRALFGLPREGVVTQADIVSRIVGSDAQRVVAAIDSAVEAGRSLELDYSIALPDGAVCAIHSICTFVAVEAGGRPRMFGVFSDVTQTRQTEAALRGLNETLERRVAEAAAECEAAHEALRQSQKMEAVGQLSGGLAHDFNNLLTGIMGSLELLQTRFAQGRTDGIDRYITAAQGAARRAAAVTHRLLAFSRRQTLAPEITDIRRLVESLQDVLGRTIGRDSELELVGPDRGDESWCAMVDPGQLQDALLSLCVNARDAMPGGGRMTIKIANLPLGDEQAHENDLPPGDYVCLSVADTGTGMTAETIARAFDPFFTTKPLGLGTGLGLSMIYGFARQSGGHVRIISDVGKGTQVCLYLPRHTAVEEVPFASPEALALSPCRQCKAVLIVDDEPTVRMLVSDLIEGEGHSAMQAEDGAAAMRILHSAAPIDLLVTDVGLPGGMNGRQVADAARALRPGLTVLFITGFAETSLLGNGHLDPGMHVLTKPFTMGALAGRVNALLGGEPA